MFLADGFNNLGSVNMIHLSLRWGRRDPLSPIDIYGHIYSGIVDVNYMYIVDLTDETSPVIKSEIHLYDD